MGTYKTLLTIQPGFVSVMMWCITIFFSCGVCVIITDEMWSAYTANKNSLGVHFCSTNVHVLVILMSSCSVCYSAVCVCVGTGT